MRRLLEQVTRTAGEFLLGHFRQEPDLLEQRSPAKEAATSYDKMADDLIVRGIKEEYPDHSLLTEEGGLLDGDPDWLWIVDSLDGTGNYANWNPLFCVCVALRHREELVLGAIYAPAIDEFYIAQKGEGAYLNDIRIRVSDISFLGESYLFYCEGGEKDRERTGWFLNRVYPEVVDIRKLGSAGLETAWVAAGRGEAYFTTSIEPWDVAPGVLLVAEAGGMTSDFKGHEWNMKKGDLLFSNSRVHSPLLNLLR
ncbi:inositol monophosphatase family protein [Chloroflexota bacterium]